MFAGFAGFVGFVGFAKLSSRLHVSRFTDMLF